LKHERIQASRVDDERQFFGFHLPDTFLRQDDITVLTSLNLRTHEDIKRECKDRNHPPYVLEVLHELLQVCQHSDPEDSVVDLVKALMRSIGIVGFEGFTMISPKKMGMMMCGQTTFVYPEVFQDESSAPLFPQPQLAAAMIAAFGFNNAYFKVEQQTMYGIIMSGSESMFYRCEINTTIFDGPGQT
jgi:hypothetical protein